MGSHLRTHFARKVGAGSIVDGNDNYAGQSASKEGRDPLGTVRGPKDDGITFYDMTRFEFARKTIGESRDPLVGPALVTVSARKYVGGIRGPAFEIVQRIE